ncbi:hypothetical protein ACFS3C_21855 [Azotobacter vinelandii]
MQFGQMQMAAPQAIPLQLAVQALEGQLLVTRFTEAQSVQGQFQGEGIELQALQVGRLGDEAGELPIDHLLGDARENEEAEQAIEGGGCGQGNEGGFQSFGHGNIFSFLTRLGREYVMSSPIPEAERLSPEGE